MRFRLASIALTALLPLAACSPSGAPDGPGAITADAVSGNLVSNTPATLGDGATATLALLDITGGSGAHIPITSVTEPVSAVPGPFRLPIDRASLNPARAYGITATVFDGGTVRFVTDQPIPVLTRGTPATLDVTMVAGLQTAVLDDTVAFKQEFRDFEERLGGLSQLTLSSRLIGTEGNQTGISGDAFTDETGVRMVRENLALPNDGGRIERRFAFKDGKLWVAHQSNGDNVMLGWDVDGQLVVTERNGRVDESAASYADALKAQAVEALALAEAKRR